MKFERGAGIFAIVFSVVVILAALALAFYVLRLDSVIRHKFEGQRWDIPAKVFARPLEIYNQAAVNLADLKAELDLLGYKSSNTYKKSGTYVEDADTLYIHTRGFDFGDSQEPEQILQVRFAGEQIAEVRATAPATTGIARLEPILIGGIYPQHNEDRVLIKLNKVPKNLIHALIATEDRNFYNHYGLSIRGTARALVSNVTGGKRQGGSTLTQQLVKNFYLSPERTLKRKVNEALMALLLEMHYSKDEILEAYLNEVNLGQNGNYSINGYGLASQYYFGLPLSELNTAQQAYLVGLVQGPSLYNPWRNPELALKRRNVVLNNMLLMGYLTQEQYDKELARPLGVLSKPGVVAAKYPDFLDIVRRQLRSEYQEDDLTNQGLRIFTTLDPLAQNRVESAFKSAVADIAKSNPKRLQDLQGALLIAKPENGELIAAVGSTQNFTGFNRALDAKRQVGSLLKPIIYLSAIESGRYNWSSPIEDTAIELPSDGRNWTPKNYDGVEHGIVSMRQALANSYNLAAVRLGQEFGIAAFSNNLRKMGVKSDIPPYPSVFLGAVNLSPMDVMGVYENFATGGYNYPTRSIRAVVDAKGHLLERYGLEVQQSIDPAVAYVLNFGLQQVMDVGTGRAAYNTLPTNLRLAGKSGTTNDTRDSWFAGYSGNHVAVVWLGLDNNKVTGLTGSSGALPVWTKVMAQLKQKPVKLKMNDSVQWQWIDSASGYLSAEGCAGGVLIPMLRNTVPDQLTLCAQNALAIESSAPAASAFPSDNGNNNEPNMNDNSEIGIIDSEPPMQNEPPANQRVISSGSYNGTAQ